MSKIIKSTDELGYRARADRHIQSGRVVLVDRDHGTAWLDVGMKDVNGNPVYMQDVPFSPQTPPQVQDIVPLLRTNSSPYSMTLGSGAQVGGANTGQVTVAGGAVSSLKKTGETAGQQGDITLDPGAGINITRTGKTFSFASTGATEPQVAFTMTLESGIVQRVAMQVEDATGADISEHRGINIWLGDTAYSSPTLFTPTGGIAVVDGFGILSEIASIMALYSTDGTGLLTIDITDGVGQNWYVHALLGSRIFVSPFTMLEGWRLDFSRQENGMYLGVI